MLSAHIQGVCGCFKSICEVPMTISHCLPILRMYVVVLNPFVKLLWPFHLVCTFSVCMWLFLIHLWSCSDHFMFVCSSSGCMWLFSVYLWSCSDHFILSAHPQDVCGCPSFWSIHEVSLTISCCLSISLCLLIQPVCDCSQFICEVALTISLCPSSACMCALIYPWSPSDHFTLSAHPQPVRGCSWFICEVSLTILQYLPTLSLYVIVLNPFMKSFWSSHLFCSSSACMWLVSICLWSPSDHLTLSVHPQHVCDCSFNPSVRLTWILHVVCPSYDCMYFPSNFL